MIEMAGTALLVGLLVWTMFKLSWVRTDLEAQKAATATERTNRVAAEMSHESCKAAVLQVSNATAALGKATQEAYASVDRALGVARVRRQTTASEITRILAVRPGKNDDCEVAKGLAQGAWRERQ